MQNITYLIGAGASYYSLPLIKTMNQRMCFFHSYLIGQRDSERITHKYLNEFIEILEELIEIESDRTSIDAYARELSLSNDSSSKLKLLHLKIVLSGFLIFEQLSKPKNLEYKPMYPTSYYNSDIMKMISTTVDRRYITFWGELLNQDKDSLPQNINIISWNYDMQFEASYSKIKRYSLELTQQNLQVFPSTVKEITLNNSSILKLNGTAGLYFANGSNCNFNLFDFNKHTLEDSLVHLFDSLEYNHRRENLKPIFYFAWENEDSVIKTRRYAKEIISQSNVMVIIGYSFPNFNRLIDRELFSDISQLSKIYFQAPKNEYPDLLDKLDGVNQKLKSLTIGKHDLENFFIPTEYW